MVFDTEEDEEYQSLVVLFGYYLNIRQMFAACSAAFGKYDKRRGVNCSGFHGNVLVGCECSAYRRWVCCDHLFPASDCGSGPGLCHH